MARHTHKYIRAQLRFAQVWRCADPDCNHWMPPHQEGIMEGRASICWQCGEKFVLDIDALKEEMPRCAICRMPEYLETDIDEILLKKKLEK